MNVRLQKYLADCGVASRRKAEQLILAGEVSVNGTVITTLGFQIDDEKDEVAFQGKPVNEKEKKIYIMLNKPRGYVTTVKDQFDRPTVLDLLPNIKERLFPIGRLDYDTAGLILLTNDGALTYKLTHPKHEIEKVYIARIKGIPTKEEMARFQNGLAIEDYFTAPAKIKVLKTEDGNATVQITIREGKNRQVRKMCEAIGHTVAYLKRIATGKLLLGQLELGKYRSLTPQEIAYLKEL